MREFPLPQQPEIPLDPITYEMVTSAIWSLPLSLHKATGWDQISASHLRLLPRELVRGLAHVFTCLDQQQQWTP
eukprot:2941004-Amphidinium_carterae.1